MILDTCAVLWFAFDRTQLSASAVDAIVRSDSVRISTMSFWEIEIKIMKKKLEIPCSMEELAHLYIRHKIVEFIAPDLDIITRALKLEWQHRDPVDRIIVATAQKFKDQIVTGDAAIAAVYPKTMR